jgi:hypothetical protein
MGASNSGNIHVINLHIFGAVVKLGTCSLHHSASVGDWVEVVVEFGDHKFELPDGALHSKELILMETSNVKMEFFDVTTRQIGLEIVDDTLRHVFYSSELIFEMASACGTDWYTHHVDGQEPTTTDTRKHSENNGLITTAVPAMEYIVGVIRVRAVRISVFVPVETLAASYLSTRSPSPQ